MKSDKQFNSFILILLIFVFLLVGGLILLQVGKKISPEKNSQTSSKNNNSTPSLLPSPTQKLFGNSEFTCLVNEPSLKNPIKIFVKNGKMKAEILGADGKQRNIILSNKDFFVWEKDSHQGVHYIASKVSDNADMSSNPFINQLKIMTEVSESHPDCQKSSIAESELLVPSSIAFITPASSN